MKKLLAVLGVTAVAVIAVCIYLFYPFKLKTEIVNPAKLEIISGEDGTLAVITNPEHISKITDNITSMEFRRGRSSKDYSGWSYRLVWYDETAGKELYRMVVLSDNLVEYKNRFYTDKENFIDTAYLDIFIETQRANDNGEQLVTAEFATKELLADKDSYNFLRAEDSPYSSNVVFTSELPIKDFNVNSLYYTGFDGSDPIYSVTKLCTADNLNKPLVVEMVFYGAIPNMGVSYTDMLGNTRNYALTTHGGTGALIMPEIDVEKNDYLSANQFDKADFLNDEQLKLYNDTKKLISGSFFSPSDIYGFFYEDKYPLGTYTAEPVKGSEFYYCTTQVQWEEFEADMLRFFTPSGMEKFCNERIIDNGGYLAFMDADKGTPPIDITEKYCCTEKSDEKIKFAHLIYFTDIREGESQAEYEQRKSELKDFEFVIINVNEFVKTPDGWRIETAKYID